MWHKTEGDNQGVCAGQRLYCTESDENRCGCVCGVRQARAKQRGEPVKIITRGIVSQASQIRSGVRVAQGEDGSSSRKAREEAEMAGIA